MASNDLTEDIPHVNAEALAYFADQLKRSGKYAVSAIPKVEVGPPKSAPPYTKTSTPYKPYIFRNKVPVQDEAVPPRPPPPPRSFFLESLPQTSGLGDTFTLGVPAGTSPGTSRIPKLPQFSGEAQKGDSDFDVWRYDLTCLIHSGVYQQHILLEAIRQSLKGRARSVLLHLGELASVSDIMSELEAIYGNVATPEKLKEQFYMAFQQDKETVADYSLRLEQLLRHSSLHFDQQTKDEMLRNRLWSGLRDKELKNAARYKFETVRSFNLLRTELRKIELELGLTPEKDDKRRGKSENRQEVTSNMTLVESKLLKQLETLTTQMKTMNSKMETMDKDIRDLKKGNSSGTQRHHDLNRKGPPQKGQ